MEQVAIVTPGKIVCFDLSASVGKYKLIGVIP